MAAFFTYLFFFGAPTASVVWFIVSLVRLLNAPKDSRERVFRRRTFIASAVTLGFFVMLFVAIAALFVLAVAYM